MSSTKHPFFHSYLLETPWKVSNNEEEERPQIILYFKIFCSADRSSGESVRNDPGDLGSIPGWVIPKTQKMVLDATLFNTQHNKVRIRVQWSDPEIGLVPSPTPWFCIYGKGSFQVTLHNGRKLYFTLYIYIYIYVCVYVCVCVCVCLITYACTCEFVSVYWKRNVCSWRDKRIEQAWTVSFFN